jgi:hypothetical protein
MKHFKTPETAETLKHPQQAGMSSAGLLVTVIVATVTVVVLATAIPSLLRSAKNTDATDGPTGVTAKLKANEAGVLAALRVITEAESAYVLSGSSEKFASYQELRASGGIDSAFTESGLRGGYVYKVSVGASGRTYCLTAVRASRADGDLAYSVSQNGVIYQMAGDAAPKCDPETGLITSGTILGR